MYIVRFEDEGNFIRTLYLKDDKDTLDFIIDILEKQKKSYVLVKDLEKNKDKFKMSCLLDFKGNEVYKNCLVQRLYEKDN